MNFAGNRPDLYGQQRKWGAVGWGLFTLISGFLVDVVSGDALIKNYSPCYWIAGILLTLNFFVCWKWDVWKYKMQAMLVIVKQETRADDYL